MKGGCTETACTVRMLVKLSVVHESTDIWFIIVFVAFLSCTWDAYLVKALLKHF